MPGLLHNLLFLRPLVIHSFIHSLMHSLTHSHLGAAQGGSCSALAGETTVSRKAWLLPPGAQNERGSGTSRTIMEIIVEAQLWSGL